MLDAPHGLLFDEPPSIKAVMRGEGSGITTVRIGRGVQFGRNVQLEVWAGGSNELAIADDAYLLDGVRLSLRSGTLRLGERTNVRDYSVLKTEGELLLGDDVSVSYGCVLHCARRIELQDQVGMAERVTIVDSEKRHDGSDRHFLLQPLQLDPVLVGRNVFVGAGVVITRGSTVGRNTVVAAGAVLTGGDYPSGWVVGGVPAKPLAPLGEKASGARP